MDMVGLHCQTASGMARWLGLNVTMPFCFTLFPQPIARTLLKVVKFTIISAMELTLSRRTRTLLSQRRLKTLQPRITTMLSTVAILFSKRWSFIGNEFSLSRLSVIRFCKCNCDCGVTETNKEKSAWRERENNLQYFYTQAKLMLKTFHIQLRVTRRKRSSERKFSFERRGISIIYFWA